MASQVIPEVLQESSTLNQLQSRSHGLDHWWRVWKNAVMLAKDIPEVDLEIVALFTLFHDSMRQHDFDDIEHGSRGWVLWKYIEDGSGLILTTKQDRNLEIACVEHSLGQTNPDPTIGVCWDANRLDSYRLGIWPDPRFMSTGPGRLITLSRMAKGV